MKKCLCFALAALRIFALASCARADIIKTYDDPQFMPSQMTFLYPEEPDDESFAVLLRKYDESASAVAVGMKPDGEFNVIYRLPEGKLTYELTAYDGIIAFYELTAYSDGSVNYALKVIDTKDNNKVHSPYKKTVSEEGDLQTRFIVIYNNAVYYLTKSNLLGRCRVMKYNVKTDELTEYLSFDFTENTMTDNASCTSISGKGGYLTCAAVSGNKTTLKTYDLNNDELVREKELPYGAAIVYMADHDYNTGLYAIYYYSAQREERVGVFAYSDDTIDDVYSLSDDEYLNHEEVRIDGGNVVFTVQDTSKTVPHEQFYHMERPVSGGEFTKYQGVFDTVRVVGDMWGLEFDSKKGYDAVNLIIIME